MSDPDLPRVAIAASVLGLPSEVWIERQVLGFTRIKPVFFGWKAEPGWQSPSEIESYLVPGPFGGKRTLARRVMARLGFPGALKPRPAQIEATRATLAEASVDAVLCHFAWTAMAVAPALPPGMPLILHVHGRDVSALMASAAYRRRLAQVLQRTGSLVAVGNHQIKRLKPLGLPGRVALIPCGAPLDIFSNSSIPRQTAEGPIRFISVGRMSPEKGMRETLQAFEQIAGDFPNAELVLVGFGPDFEAIQDTARKSPFAARIRLTGRLGSEDVAHELSQAHVFVLHSRSIGGWLEGSPVSLVEAGAAGLPLIASAIGGVADQITPGHNGFLFQENDLVAQVGHMRRLAADPVLRAQMGIAAREIARGLDSRLMIRKLEDEILATHGA